MAIAPRLNGAEVLEVAGYLIALGFVVIAGAEISTRLRKRVGSRFS